MKFRVHKMIMEFRVYIVDLKAYNNGEFKGEWVNLPMDEEELHEVIMRHTNNGNTDYAIHDYENFLNYRVHEYTNIYELNRLVERIYNLEEWELDALEVGLDNFFYNLEDALEAVEAQNFSIFYLNDATDEALGHYLVDEGYLGEIPEHLEIYLDYEAVGREYRLSNGGDYAGYFTRNPYYVEFY